MQEKSDKYRIYYYIVNYERKGEVNKRMDNWSKCPRCGSNRVQKISKWIYVLTFFAGSGCLIWLGIILPLFWIFIPIFWIIAIVMLFGKDVWQCQDCKYSWKVQKVKKSSNEQESK